MSTETVLVAAIRAAASANLEVQARLGVPARIYDDPPPDPVFPYVTLGRVETRGAASAERETLEHIVTLHVWSRYGGRAEAMAIVAALRAALHNAPLDLEDHTLIFLFASFADVFRSGDGRTTHGVLRLRAMTEPNE